MAGRSKASRSELPQWIKDHGGLMSLADIAVRHDVSRARAAQWTQFDGFPEPIGRIARNRTRIWLGIEVDQFVVGRRLAEPARHAAAVARRDIVPDG